MILDIMLFQNMELQISLINMENKFFVILILTALLLFGCTGGEQTPAGETETGSSGDGLEDLGEVVGLECDAEYTFSAVEGGTFGKTSTLLVTATCAKNETLTATVDGEPAGSVKIDTNKETEVELDVVALKDGTVTLAVTSQGESLYSQEWEVEVLGNADISGMDYDAISFKEWRAMAFDLDGQVDVGRIRVYMKRLEGRTEPNTNIILEVRKDSSDNPGQLEESVTIPITDVTLNYNWVNFDFEEKANLGPGKYWIVMKIEQTENIKLVSDKVMVHYTVVDREADGNEYTRQMMLSVDEKTGFASETEWDPLSYDKLYNVVLRYE